VGGFVGWLTCVCACDHRWCWEVGVLSRRSLLDLVRNPLLLTSHFLAMTYFAGEGGPLRARRACR
jgi:hypothetical protein